MSRKKLTENQITSHQCRAARAILDWKQTELSEKSEISITAIKNFELNNTTLQQPNQEKLIKTFSKEKVNFIKFENSYYIKVGTEDDKNQDLKLKLKELIASSNLKDKTKIIADNLIELID